MAHTVNTTNVPAAAAFLSNASTVGVIAISFVFAHDCLLSVLCVLLLGFCASAWACSNYRQKILLGLKIEKQNSFKKKEKERIKRAGYRE